MSRIFACLIIALLVASGPLRAEVVKDLYAATVPVRDQGSEALTVSAGLALAQVLVKVSGSEETLRDPAVSDALRNARSEVQQYAFLPPKGEDPRQRVRMEFDADRVTELLLAAGLPLWTANRRPVLVWLVLEDEAGLSFATSETNPELVSELRTVFAERGVPLRLPLYDLRDAAAISPDDVWRLDAEKLTAASTRYGVEHIVGARLTGLSGGEWIGDWAHLEGAERRDLRIEAASTQEYLREGTAAMAERLAARYAVVASEENANGVAVRVSGVEEYTDLATIVRWLEDLEVVQRAAVTRVSGDRLELTVQARADAAELATLITLNDRLAPRTEPLPGAPLEYQWLR